jgi:hypothetical protein
MSLLNDYSTLPAILSSFLTATESKFALEPVKVVGIYFLRNGDSTLKRSKMIKSIIRHRETKSGQTWQLGIRGSVRTMHGEFEPTFSGLCS